MVGRIVRRCFEVDLVALDVGEEVGAAVHLDEQTSKEEFRRRGFRKGCVEDLFQEVEGRKEGESVDVRGEGGKNVGGRRGRSLLQRRRHRERTALAYKMEERVSFVL